MTELHGVERFLATLDTAAAQLEDMSSAHDAAGALLVTRGQANAPRKTGVLAASLAATTTPTELEVVVAAPYAAAVEAANPWFSTTLELVEGELTAIYTEAVTEAVNTIEGV